MFSSILNFRACGTGESFEIPRLLGDCVVRRHEDHKKKWLRPSVARVARLIFLM
jgi:hypothetical protein